MSFSKKPPKPDPDNKQLFSFDVSTLGAKNFLFNTYENIYNIIKSSKNSNYYEDNTYSNGIKLFIDFDDKITFNNQLERDKCAENITNNITEQVNSKIKNTFNIENPPIIILISDTLLKLSIHIVYPNIIFNTIYEMKYFMIDINLIDQSVYKTGCFRMLFCSKMGKQNILKYHDSINYIKPSEEYQLFLDSCICYTENKSTVKININTIDQSLIKNPKRIIQKQQTNTITRNYTYRNVDFEIIKSSLDKLKEQSHKYEEWLTIALCLKDLYLGLSESKKEQLDVYDLFDDFSKNSNSYNKIVNRKIFNSLDPVLDINYLFKLSEDKHYILPFYNYRQIIFNPQNHTNIIIQNQRYIDTKIEDLLKYRYILFKSPTGSGKTTFLKKLIEQTGVNNIISITSRVNLAGEHVNSLNLSFYLNMKSKDEFDTCNRLVIQMESLKKCNYKLFKNGIVILDEINSLLSHMRSPTMNNKRRDVYIYISELIKNAKYIIGLDADLSDWNIRFLQEIKTEKNQTTTPKPLNDYIIYYNTNKNKTGTPAIVYACSQTLINTMIEHLKNKKYFISCFDSLKQMNTIIDFLSQSIDGSKEDFLIYSSEVNYDIIDTKTWINKFVFFTPSIIYGIDYSHNQVDVFSFTHKKHLNSTQIYQMMSRARNQGTLHLYCNPNIGYIKYKSVEDVIYETSLYEKNFSSMMPLYNNFIDIDDKPYRTMFYNYKFMDSILKTNIKGYLIDMLIDKGYTVTYNNTYNQYNLPNDQITLKTIKERICEMLQFDKDNLSDLEQKLAYDNKALEKHFNLRILLNNSVDDKLVESITQNLFIETLKNKNTKIKICQELMNLLEITNLESLNKNLTKNFTNTIESEWLSNNIKTIKKTFDIRGTKYDTFTYHNIYLLLITILKSLFDHDLFNRKEVQIKKCKFIFYELDEKLLQEHQKIITKFDNNWKYFDFI